VALGAAVVLAAGVVDPLVADAAAVAGVVDAGVEDAGAVPGVFTAPVAAVAATVGRAANVTVTLKLYGHALLPGPPVELWADDCRLTLVTPSIRASR
jgi:hypothetical protein